jgi:hypothetical protein
MAHQASAHLRAQFLKEKLIVFLSFSGNITLIDNDSSATKMNRL